MRIGISEEIIVLKFPADTEIENLKIVAEHENGKSAVFFPTPLLTFINFFFIASARASSVCHNLFFIYTNYMV